MNLFIITYNDQPVKDWTLEDAPYSGCDGSHDGWCCGNMGGSKEIECPAFFSEHAALDWLVQADWSFVLSKGVRRKKYEVVSSEKLKFWHRGFSSLDDETRAAAVLEDGFRVVKLTD